MSQICEGKWLAQGLAKKEQPAAGGKSQWFVHETADPALARVKFGHQMPADLTHLTSKKRDQALFRRGILEEWSRKVRAGFELGFGRVRTTNHFLLELETRGVRISMATLYNWEREFRDGGLAALVDDRGSKATAPGKDDPFFKVLSQIYLVQQQPKLTFAHELACRLAKERGFPIRSYEQSKRFIRNIPRDVLAKYRGGVEDHNNEATPFLKRDYSGLRSNQIWCGDHHQFDVIVDAGGGNLVRPWLTAWQDVRSRKIVGWHVFCHDPNSDTIQLAFKSGVETHYVPESVLVDNGKDYDCYALNGRTKKDRWAKRKLIVNYDSPAMGGLFGAVGVEVFHCEPYHGQSKPVERWFETMEDSFGRAWDTYCGNSPQNKPEQLTIALERGKAPKIETFIEAFGTWLDAWHEGHKHSGDAMDGKTPAAVWTECLEFRRVANPKALPFLLMKCGKPVRVTRNGVTLNGLQYGFGERSLYEKLGQDVLLYSDPRNVAQVWASTTGGEFFALLNLNQSIPFLADAQALREAMAEKRRVARTASEYFEAGPKRGLSTVDLMIDAALDKAKQARAERGEQPLPEPPPIRPVRSKFEDQLDKMERIASHSAKPAMRKVVGGSDGEQEIDVIAALAERAESSRRSARRDEDDGGINLLEALS